MIGTACQETDMSARTFGRRSDARRAPAGLAFGLTQLLAPISLVLLTRTQSILGRL